MGKSSKYFGVVFNKSTGKYMARLLYQGNDYYLGLFVDEDCAAKAVDLKSIEIGYDRRLNFQTYNINGVMSNTKLIHLTKGMFAIVDEEDFERVNQHKWYAYKAPTTYYAQRKSKNRNTYEDKHMHHMVLGLRNVIVDHIDGDGLNNRKSNLRRCTTAQNNCNKIPLIKTSKYKGVHYSKKAKQFISMIRVNGKTKYLGHFNDELDAARIYDDKAKEVHGEFAWLNFPDK